MPTFVAKVEHMMSDFEEIATLEAENENEARTLLTKQGFFVYEIWIEEDEAV